MPMLRSAISPRIICWPSMWPCVVFAKYAAWIADICRPASARARLTAFRVRAFTSGSVASKGRHPGADDIDRDRHSAEIPPVRLIAWPVILAAAGEARKTTSAASSSLLTTPSAAASLAFANIFPANGSAITLS